MRETIAALDQQGVAVRMVTGDHVAIARQIGYRLGMDGEFATADKVFVGEAQPTAEALLANEGYAQVSPSTSTRSYRYCRAVSILSV